MVHKITSQVYTKGEVIGKDLEKAICWYSKAAENGDKVSQYNLGCNYELGIGIDKDEIKAFEYYEKSAEYGLVEATFQLGYCYLNGIGTEVNKEKGFELYDKAAGKKYKSYFNENDNEIISDLDNVNYWYHKAAEDDNMYAIYKLGGFYELGKGVGQNEIKAFYFYKKSAQYKLGYFYEKGIVIDTNK